MLSNPNETIRNSYSAPAKFILSGEHSVVYNKDALVATIDMRTYGDSFLSFDKKENLDYFADIKLNQSKVDFKIVNFSSF